MNGNFYQLTVKIAKFLRREPKNFYWYGKALIKGFFYMIFFRIFRKNVKIKLPFFVHYKVSISGPGEVFIDRYCTVLPNSFDGLTIVTLSADSRVHIGRGCDLGGVTVRCNNKVAIDDHVMFANCLIQDGLFSVTKSMSLKHSKTEQASLSLSEIHIGRNCWLTPQTIVLGGSNIGDESVLSIGSVCFDRDVSKHHLAIGNPVFYSLNIEKIESFLGTS
jgi:acetyltransferase-like isoleucine patch superfamily enzyme